MSQRPALLTISTPSLLIMACSAAKLQQSAPALELYRGVMYGTFRANVQPTARPHVVILSALHGFIAADTVIEPYEQRMTPERADAISAKLNDFMCLDWPAGAGTVMLAGGAEYRRVMRAAVRRLNEEGRLAPNVAITETSGGIGYQRQQLGTFLRTLAPFQEVVGHHANGTPLYRALEGFTVDQHVDIVYQSRPDLEPQPAVIAELFEGPCGPTANVRLPNANNPSLAHTWVGLNQLRKKAQLA